MLMLPVRPLGGINRRQPEHVIGRKTKAGIEECQELRNLISLDNRIRIVPGASRLDQTAKSGDVKWCKRIYYSIGGDFKKDQFCVILGKLYKLNESAGTLNQVPISASMDIQMDADFWPIDATIKIAEQVTTFLVDGEFFYKFNGNDSGNWDQLPIKQDVDGNDIEPIYILEYLDRLFVLVKKKNILIFSKNINPENFSDSTDAGIIDLPPGKGGFPTGLIVENGFLHVIHEDYIAPVTGDSVATFGVRPGDITHGYGTRAPRSIVSLDGRFAFLNSKNNEIHVSDDLTKPMSYDIKLKTLINPVKSDITVCHLDTELNAIRVNYVLTGEVTLNAEEIFSLDEKKWCGQTRDRHISCYSQWNGRGDDGRLITGRADTGLLMVQDASLGFDSSPIHYKFVSASYIAEDDITDVEFTEFFIDAKAYGNFNIPLAYYIDTRLTTNAVEGVNMQGEIINLGLIEISDQDVFLNRALPFIDKRRGRMIRFQIEETAANRVFEFYGIFANYNVQNAKMSKYILGR